MSLEKIAVSQNAIADFCRRWQVTELAIFGSVLRDDFSPESDVDVLVTFAPQAHWTLLDFVTMQDDLSALFGRQADLVMRTAVQNSRNGQRRTQILNSAQVVYVA